MITAADSTAAQRDVLRYVARGGVVHLMLRGPSASGKSALLNEIRDRLGASATIVDDAHGLSEAELTAVAEQLERADQSVVVATEPRPHSAGMRALAAAVTRIGRVFDLRALSPADVSALARRSGTSLSADRIEQIVSVTGGVEGAVRAALDAADLDPAPAVERWARAVLRIEDTELLTTLALAVSGAGLDEAEVADIVGVDNSVALMLIDRVRACGLVADQDVLLPIATEPLRGVLGERRFADTQQRLFEARHAAGTLRDRTAIRLADAGVHDHRLVEFLCARAAVAEPTVAYELYAAAARAGANVTAIAQAYCTSAALAGDLETAQAIADSILARPDADAAELAGAVRVLASIWAARGQLDRAADLYAWLGCERVGVDAGFAAAVLYAVGRPVEAAEVLAAPHSGPPTERATAIAALGTAMRQSVTGPAGPALAALLRSAAAGRGPAVVQPLDPVAVTIQLCLHNGDVDRARLLVERTPGTSHSVLLGAWTALLSGDEESARIAVDGLPAGARTRDQLLASGIRVGLARRSGNHGELVAAWSAATAVLDEVFVDVFTLLPLGELWLAAIRLDCLDRIRHLVADAHALLDRLGDPPAWANTFHWYGVQAALLANDPAALVPHARALGRAADHPAGDPYAAALASAGRTWLRVMREEAQRVDVERSARTLGSIGLPWDGARLASEGALRAPDTETATVLLQVARSLRQSSRVVPAAADERASSSPLSERESEVAELLLLGLTYREVGSRLYISAKTVEHHVARIRRRLGAGSRSELLSMLRAMGHGENDRPQPV